MIIRKTNYRLPVVVGVATYNGKGRKETLKLMLKSLEDQVDEVILYNNEVEKENLTDNGKFKGLISLNEPVYYLTCDDDLLYFPTYVKDMIEAIEKYNCICTHHGRQLLGLDKNYYRGHKSFRCLSDTEEGFILDVPGTGVTGWSTEYFNPKEIWAAEEKRMSDLVFGLAAAEEKRKIILLGHKTGYIQQLNINLKDTIWAAESTTSQTNQIKLSNKIYLLNNSKTI